MHDADKDGWYIGGAAAADWLTSSKKEENGTSINYGNRVTPGGSLFVGRRVTENIRIEGEFLYRRFAENTKENGSSVRKVNGKSFGGLTNIYYDFMAGQKFRPYVGVGVGYGSIDVEDKRSTGRVTVRVSGIAYQAGAGASYALASDIEAFGGYRYLAIGDSAKRDHEILAGLRYNF